MTTLQWISVIGIGAIALGAALVGIGLWRSVDLLFTDHDGGDCEFGPDPHVPFRRQP